MLESAQPVNALFANTGVTFGIVTLQLAAVVVQLAVVVAPVGNAPPFALRVSVKVVSCGASFVNTFMTSISRSNVVISLSVTNFIAYLPSTSMSPLNSYLFTPKFALRLPFFTNPSTVPSGLTYTSYVS